MGADSYGKLALLFMFVKDCRFASGMILTLAIMSACGLS